MTLPDLSALTWIPSFTFSDCDVPESFSLTVPQAPWQYTSKAKGGWATVDSGVDESFVTRHDRMYILRLRMTEEEFVESFEPMMRILWAQAQAFTVQLDKAVGATAETVRLVAPVAQEEITPVPMQFFGMLEVAITVRTDDGSAFSYPYHASLA